MLVRSIRQAWNAAFPGAPPVGFLCRSAAADRWLRTHSLPESKRYPDSAEEYAEVLRRYNATALHTLGPDAECFLFVTRFGADRQWKYDDIMSQTLNKIEFAHVMSHGEKDDVLQLFVTPVIWQTGAFDVLLSAVAEDQTGPVLFFSPTRRSAFAPYDGGADLFLASAEEAQKAKTHFAAWLSLRSDGL
jgi:hypothetical protein